MSGNEQEEASVQLVAEGEKIISSVICDLFGEEIGDKLLNSFLILNWLKKIANFWFCWVGTW